MNALVWSTKASCWIKHRSCWVNSYFWRTANRDRKLAERRLEEFKSQIGCLSLGDDSRLGFAAVAHRWLESVRHTLAPGTIQQREIRIKNIAPFFKGSSLRNITPAQCERWAIQRGARLAPQTFVHELETMRTVFDYGRKHGLVMTNPTETIRGAASSPDIES